MVKATGLGFNRTGMDLAKILSKEMIENENIVPESGSGYSISSFRNQFIKEADQLGSVPIPGTLKGMAKSVGHTLTGDRPEVIIDKLGERLAFERTGTRLYELLIAKCEAEEDTPPELLTMLKRNQAEEEMHFHMIHDIMKALGADPTAMTPAANTVGVMSMGLMQTLADPRTTVTQGLAAILTAELIDHASWELLYSLLDQLGIDAYHDSVKEAMMHEDRHLREVRSWHTKLMLAEATKTSPSEISSSGQELAH